MILDPKKDNTSDLLKPSDDYSDPLAKLSEIIADNAANPKPVTVMPEIDPEYDAYKQQAVALLDRPYKTIDPDDDLVKDSVNKLINLLKQKNAITVNFESAKKEIYSKQDYSAWFKSYVVTPQEIQEHETKFHAAKKELDDQIAKIQEDYLEQSLRQHAKQLATDLNVSGDPTVLAGLSDIIYNNIRKTAQSIEDPLTQISLHNDIDEVKTYDEYAALLKSSVDQKLQEIKFPETLNQAVAARVESLKNEFEKTYIESVYFKIQLDFLHQSKSSLSIADVTMDVVSAQRRNENCYIQLKLLAQQCEPLKDTHLPADPEKIIADNTWSASFIDTWMTEANSIIRSQEGYEQLTEQQKGSLAEEFVVSKEELARQEKDKSYFSSLVGWFVTDPTEQKILEQKAELAEKVQEKIHGNLLKLESTTETAEQLIVDCQIEPEQLVSHGEAANQQHQELSDMLKQMVYDEVANKARLQGQKALATLDLVTKIKANTVIAKQMQNIPNFNILSLSERKEFLKKMAPLVEQFEQIKIAQQNATPKTLAKLQAKETQLKQQVNDIIKEIISAIPEKDQLLFDLPSATSSNLSMVDDLLNKIPIRVRDAVAATLLGTIVGSATTAFTNVIGASGVATGVAVLTYMDPNLKKVLSPLRWLFNYSTDIILSEAKDIINKPKAYIDRTFRSTMLLGSTIGMVIGAVALVGLIGNPFTGAPILGVVGGICLGLTVIAGVAKLSKWISSSVATAIYKVDDPDHYIPSKAAITALGLNIQPDHTQSPNKSLFNRVISSLGFSSSSDPDPTQEKINALKKLMITQIGNINKEIYNVPDQRVDAGTEKVEQLQKKLQLINKIWDEVQNGDNTHWDDLLKVLRIEQYHMRKATIPNSTIMGLTDAFLDDAIKPDTQSVDVTKSQPKLKHATVQFTIATSKSLKEVESDISKFRSAISLLKRDLGGR